MKKFFVLSISVMLCLISVSLSCAAPITFTDVSGAPHVFERPAKKVAVDWSCAGGPFMTMSALLGRDVASYLAVIDNTPRDYRADQWARYQEAVPELANVPIIGSFETEYDIERAIAEGTEVFIMPVLLKSKLESSAGATLAAAGIPVVYIDYHDETVENHVLSTRIMGMLFDRNERAEQIIDFYLKHIKGVTDRVEKIVSTRPRPNIYIEVGQRGPERYGNSFDNDYMWGGIAYSSGANNIGAGSISSSSPIDPEFLLAADPEKIVLAGSYWPNQPTSVRMGFEADESELRRLVGAYFTERPGWLTLSAYKDREVYGIHHGLAREMYDCACYEFYAKLCFKDDFADVDPEATLREYYERFLPYRYSGIWFWSMR